MLILEIIAITSAASTLATGAYKFVTAVRSNKYAANYARINELNQHERGKFSEIVVPKRHVVEGHTHGLSAASRSAGSSACATYALANNRIPFYLSMSASDQRADREGERTMHWAKDFNAEPRVAEPSETSMLVMIDVDEHIDNLPSLLHKHFLPTIMYTFQPSAASGVFSDYRYTFDKDNNVLYHVAGGGEYKHKVWNYSADTLVMRKKFFGLTYAKSFFTVEKRYVDENHQLVLLTPLAKFGLLGSILSYNVSGTDLARLTPVQGEFIRLEIARSKIGTNEYEHKTSTSRVGAYNAATVDIASDDAAAAISRTSAEKLNLFQIKSTIPDIEHVSALALLEYHRLKKSSAAPRVVVPTDAVNNYTYNPTPFTQEKPSEIAFMAPLIPECYAPTVSVENEEAMVKKRITDLKKAPDDLDEKHMKYAFEFCELIRKDIGILEPHCVEQVAEKLNRPSQRRITEEVSFADKVSDVIKSFMKKEAYQKPAAPRPIATINGKVKLEYSQFTHAVAEAIKRTSWYGFGRTPKQIAARVSAICQVAKHVINTDLSRFDGRVNRSSRQFEEMVMTTLFPKKYHKRLLALMKKQYGSKGVTRLGVKYKNGFNRQSGSPETAILNTILNVFMAYVCFRESGCEPDEAYAKLGIYGGDDGLTPDVDPDLYTKVCARFGHVLEAEVVKRGKSGVSFLSRLYSKDVWEGSPHSCADIARAASKLHVSPASDISAVDKLFEKSFALHLTDANTPIIGPFVSRAVALSGKGSADYKNILKIWNSDIEQDEQYPNDDHDGWMHEVVVLQKLDGFNIIGFKDWLAECKTLEDMLKCPELIDQQPIKLADVPIKINGDLFPSDKDFEAKLLDYMDKKKTRDASLINPPSSTNAITTTPAISTTTTTTTTANMGPVSRESTRVTVNTGSTGLGLEHTNVTTRVGDASKSRPARSVGNNNNASVGGTAHVGAGRPRGRSRRDPTSRVSDGERAGHVGSAGATTIPRARWVDTGRKSSVPSQLVPSSGGSSSLPALGNLVSVTVPQPRLVGIELNPGPGKAGKSKPKQQQQQKKRVVQVTIPAPAVAPPKQSMLGQIGSTLGNFVAGDIGKRVGSAAGSFLSKITGMGDYKVNNNTILTAGQVPTFSTYGKGLEFSNREFLMDITGTTDFTLIEEFTINPGKPRTFPWASKLAYLFEEYEILGLVFEYKPTSGTAVSSTNTALGTVVMATNYDFLDTNFASKQQMLAYEYSTSTVVCSPMIHPVECAPGRNVLRRLFIAGDAALPANADPRFYHMGKMELATVGSQSGVTTVGELHVSYHMRLHKPKLDATLGPLGAANHWYMTTISGAVPFDPAAVKRLGSNIAASIYDGLTLLLPETGVFMILYMNTNASSPGTSFGPTTTGGNITPWVHLDNNATDTFSTAGVPVNAFVHCYIVQVNAAGTGAPNKIVYSGTTGTLTTPVTDLFIVRLPEALDSLSRAQYSMEALLARLSTLEKRQQIELIEEKYVAVSAA